MLHLVLLLLLPLLGSGADVRPLSMAAFRSAVMRSHHLWVVNFRDDGDASAGFNPKELKPDLDFRELRPDLGSRTRG